MTRKSVPPPLPDCAPLTVATFRDATLVAVEQLHLATRCAGPCAGTTTRINPKDYMR